MTDREYEEASRVQTDLLRRYITHVGECEGTDFLDHNYRGWAKTAGVEFTDEEWALLRKLGGWE
jgi:hypothetical protein